MKKQFDAFYKKYRIATGIILFSILAISFYYQPVPGDDYFLLKQHKISWILPLTFMCSFSFYTYKYLQFRHLNLDKLNENSKNKEEE